VYDQIHGKVRLVGCSGKILGKNERYDKEKRRG
jgi:hypothetical protein